MSKISRTVHVSSWVLATAYCSVNQSSHQRQIPQQTVAPSRLVAAHRIVWVHFKAIEIRNSSILGSSWNLNPHVGGVKNYSYNLFWSQYPPKQTISYMPSVMSAEETLSFLHNSNTISTCQFASVNPRNRKHVEIRDTGESAPLNSKTFRPNNSG